MLWLEENGWFSKAYVNLGIESKQFLENQIITPLSMASSYYFRKQRNLASCSKWIIECAHDKELYSSLISYSSSSASWNFRQNITSLHRGFSTRLQLLEKLKFYCKTPGKLCPEKTLFILFSDYVHDVMAQIRKK